MIYSHTYLIWLYVPDKESHVSIHTAWRPESIMAWTVGPVWQRLSVDKHMWTLGRADVVLKSNAHIEYNPPQADDTRTDDMRAVDTRTDDMRADDPLADTRTDNTRADDTNLPSHLHVSPSLIYSHNVLRSCRRHWEMAYDIYNGTLILANHSRPASCNECWEDGAGSGEICPVSYCRI